MYWPTDLQMWLQRGTLLHLQLAVHTQLLLHTLHILFDILNHKSEDTFFLKYFEQLNARSKIIGYKKCFVETDERIYP